MKALGTTALVLGLAASGAHAGPKAIAIAAGDCRDPELLNGATAFSDAVSGLSGGDALQAAAVLDRLRPRPTAGVDDVQRQLDTAHSQFYDGRFDQALEGARSAAAALVRLPPSEPVTTLLQAAGVLEGLALKSLNRKSEQLEAWRRVVRTAPAFSLDSDLHSPAAIAQFEQLKREIAAAKRVPLSVSSTPSGATVFVDGVRAGVTPLKLAGFAAGRYRVIAAVGEKQSFVHEVKLETERVELVIDFAFESALRPQLPLCIAGGDSDALKLATRAGADQALVLRVDSTGWVAALLFDVGRGSRVREGGMKLADARMGNGYSELASFVLTGQPAKLALSGSRSELAPAPTQTPAAPAQPAPELTVSASRAVRRAIPLAIGGGGVVLAGVGVGLYVSGGSQRAALAGALDAMGLVKNPADAADVAFLAQRVGSNTAISLALGVGGAVMAAAGALLLFALAPQEAPSPAVLVTPSGAYAGVAGRF